VVTVGAIFCGDGVGAYVMDEVGTAVEATSAAQKQALFTALHDLHIHGVVHGDACVQNAILLSDGIMWIDFARAFVTLELSMLVTNDFSVLYESVFDQKPSATQVEAYRQCVDAKQIVAIDWVTLGVL
jgi:tRNA A-37 threonylcarbamoyl transferase component Bud32